MLREYEQLSYAEIAELLDLPVNTVRSRLFRARMALKSLLEAESGVDASAIPREVPVSTRSNSGQKTGHGSGHEPITELRPAQEEGPQ